jgi:5-methylcytosine-specific restriction enzyme A
MPSRNPTWSYDELILALDLYTRRGLLGKADPDVVELSNLLNSLPIHTVRPDIERFRNFNGVALKLANFAALDPGHGGKGMSSTGLRDREVWDLFVDDRGELARLAAALRDGASIPGYFPTSPADDEDEVAEGRLLFRRHRFRERDRGVVKRKKAAVVAAGRTLSCEVCGFDFSQQYGPLGQDFIECHHVVPLFASGTTKTRLEDLALLCSNCHRMVHRSEAWLLPVELHSIVAARRPGSPSARTPDSSAEIPASGTP